jgi:hypothetical protein
MAKVNHRKLFPGPGLGFRPGTPWDGTWVETPVGDGTAWPTKQYAFPPDVYGPGTFYPAGLTLAQFVYWCWRVKRWQARAQVRTTRDDSEGLRSHVSSIGELSPALATYCRLREGPSTQRHTLTWSAGANIAHLWDVSPPPSDVWTTPYPPDGELVDLTLTFDWSLEIRWGDVLTNAEPWGSSEKRFYPCLDFRFGITQGSPDATPASRQHAQSWVSKTELDPDGNPGVSLGDTNLYGEDFDGETELPILLRMRDGLPPAAGAAPVIPLFYIAYPVFDDGSPPPDPPPPKEWQDLVPNAEDEGIAVTLSPVEIYAPDSELANITE